MKAWRFVELLDISLKAVRVVPAVNFALDTVIDSQRSGNKLRGIALTISKRPTAYRDPSLEATVCAF